MKATVYDLQHRNPRCKTFGVTAGIARSEKKKLERSKTNIDLLLDASDGISSSFRGDRYVHVS